MEYPDQLILDSDIIDIIRSEYGITEVSDLLGFVEDEDRVSEYFEDASRGIRVIKDFVNKSLGGFKLN